jgi:hypothetical protein
MVTYYSLSSKRLVDIKITKFYTEGVLPSVNYLFIYLEAVTFFALKLCSNVFQYLMYSSAFCNVGLQVYN